MLCNKCGNINPDNTNICENCGTQMNDNQIADPSNMTVSTIKEQSQKKSVLTSTKCCIGVFIYMFFLIASQIFWTKKTSVFIGLGMSGEFTLFYTLAVLLLVLCIVGIIYIIISVLSSASEEYSISLLEIIGGIVIAGVIFTALFAYLIEKFVQPFCKQCTSNEEYIAFAWIVYIVPFIIVLILALTDYLKKKKSVFLLISIILIIGFSLYGIVSDMIYLHSCATPETLNNILEIVGL